MTCWVLGVADLANGRAAGHGMRRISEAYGRCGVLASLPRLAGSGTSGTGVQRLTRLELDRVDQGTNGNLGKRHGVAGLDVGASAGHDGIANPEALGSQDVALLAVHVVEQSDAGRAVRIVLDRGNLGRHAVLVALEVDATILTLVAAALVTDGDVAMIVTASLLGQGLEKRLLSEVVQ